MIMMRGCFVSSLCFLGVICFFLSSFTSALVYEEATTADDPFSSFTPVGYFAVGPSDVPQHGKRRTRHELAVEVEWRSNVTCATDKLRLVLFSDQPEHWPAIYSYVDAEFKKDLSCAQQVNKASNHNSTGWRCISLGEHDKKHHESQAVQVCELQCVKRRSVSSATYMLPVGNQLRPKTSQPVFWYAALANCDLGLNTVSRFRVEMTQVEEHTGAVSQLSFEQQGLQHLGWFVFVFVVVSLVQIWSVVMWKRRVGFAHPILRIACLAAISSTLALSLTWLYYLGLSGSGVAPRSLLLVGGYFSVLGKTALVLTVVYALKGWGITVSNIDNRIAIFRFAALALFFQCVCVTVSFAMRGPVDLYDPLLLEILFYLINAGYLCFGYWTWREYEEIVLLEIDMDKRVVYRWMRWVYTFVFVLFGLLPFVSLLLPPWVSVSFLLWSDAWIVCLGHVCMMLLLFPRASRAWLFDSPGIAQLSAASSESRLGGGKFGRADAVGAYEPVVSSADSLDFDEKEKEGEGKRFMA